MARAVSLGDWWRVLNERKCRSWKSFSQDRPDSRDISKVVFVTVIEPLTRLMRDGICSTDSKTRWANWHWWEYPERESRQQLRLWNLWLGLEDCLEEYRVEWLLMNLWSSRLGMEDRMEVLAA